MKDWQKKQREFEQVKARAKALKLRLSCTICGANPKTLLNCPCGTTQYCSTDCQRIDWRDRGHRKACKKIRDERAAEAARAEAPTPPPPPEQVFYGPAPRSRADEVRARIAAEHEAARARREANPDPEPTSARYGSRCPVCYEDWDVSKPGGLRNCCCRKICLSCASKTHEKPCPLCRAPWPTSHAVELAQLRRHVENEVPEAISQLGDFYRDGRPHHGIAQSMKKAAKLYKRAAELGSIPAMLSLGIMYSRGDGVKLDKKKAERLILAAARTGHPIAQLNAGINSQDRGNFQEAFRFYKMAADQGYPNAEYSVAWLYHSGKLDTGINLDEAKRFYARAAAKGHEEAKATLARFEALEARKRGA